MLKVYLEEFSDLSLNKTLDESLNAFQLEASEELVKEDNDESLMEFLMSYHISCVFLEKKYSKKSIEKSLNVLMWLVTFLEKYLVKTMEEFVK